MKSRSFFFWLTCFLFEVQITIVCYKILHRLIIESCSGKGLFPQIFFSQTLWASKTKKTFQSWSHFLILCRQFWCVIFESFRWSLVNKKNWKVLFFPWWIYGLSFARICREHPINTMGQTHTYVRGTTPSLASWFQWTTKHHLVTGSITARSPAARTPVATTRAGAGHRGRPLWMMPWRPTRWVDGSEAEKGSLEKAG